MVTCLFFQLLNDDLLGLKGLVKEIHCWPSSTNPDISETSLVQAEPTVASTVSGHAPDPPRHCNLNWNVQSMHACRELNI